MAAVSDASWARRARCTAVVIATLTLSAQVVSFGSRLAESHARLLSDVTGSLVLFMVRALREARSLDMGFGVLVGGLALGVLLGVALEAGLRRLPEVDDRSPIIDLR